MPNREANTILKERAIQLANRKSGKAADTGGKPFVIFQLGQSMYAIEATFIAKAIQNPKIFPLPSAPLYIVGMINENGRVVCVNDGSSVFGLEAVKDVTNAEVILLFHKNVEFALLVDNVAGMETLSPQLADQRFFDTTILQEYALGFTENNIILLDGEKIFSSPALIINQNPNIA